MADDASGGMASALASAAGPLTSAINMLSQGSMNRKNRAFTREMWDKQNAVNDANWHRDNAYNSPANQRKLLEAGGYNPALMYDSGGFQSASAPPAPSAGSPATRASEIDLTSAVSGYQDARLKQAQLDNIEGATRNAAASTAADVALKASQTTAGAFDLSQRVRVSDYAAEAAEKANKLLDADIALRTNQGFKSVDERQKVQEEIKQIKQNMSQSKEMHPQNMDMLKNNVKYQQFKSKLNDMGFTEHDSVLWRLFGKWGKSAYDAADKDINKTPNFKRDMHPNNRYSKGQ